MLYASSWSLLAALVSAVSACVCAAQTTSTHRIIHPGIISDAESTDVSRLRAPCTPGLRLLPVLCLRAGTFAVLNAERFPASQHLFRSCVMHPCHACACWALLAQPPFRLPRAAPCAHEAIALLLVVQHCFDVMSPACMCCSMPACCACIFGLAALSCRLHSRLALVFPMHDGVQTTGEC